MSWTGYAGKRRHAANGKGGQTIEVRLRRRPKALPMGRISHSVRMSGPPRHLPESQKLLTRRRTGDYYRDRRRASAERGRGCICPSGAVVAQAICNRQVGGFESPLGLHADRTMGGYWRYDIRILNCNGPIRYATIQDWAGVGEWLKPADCKSAAVSATQVRILPPAPRNAHTDEA